MGYLVGMLVYLDNYEENVYCFINLKRASETLLNFIELVKLIFLLQGACSILALACFIVSFI